MKLLVLFLSILIFCDSSIAKTVKHVGLVSNALKYPQHRDDFNEGMFGKRTLKSVLPCEEMAKLFEYDKKDKVDLECFTRSWSFKGKKVLLAALRREENDKATMDVGIIDKKKSPKLLLRFEKSIDLVPGFEHIYNFDPITFDLGVLGKAFGIRITKTGCGAGGNVCGDGYLHLFRIDQERLEHILASQMSYYGSFSGDWNKDGTRPHDVVEEISILKIEKDPKNSKSPPKLIKKLKSKKPKIQTYNWDAGSKVYVTKDPSFLSSIDK
jgi:hypothetical protein